MATTNCFILSAIGRTSKITAGDNWVTVEKQDVREGDLIILNRERVEVKAVATDFMSDGRLTVRTKGDFKKNHAPSAFKIAREPAVMATLVDLPAESLRFEKRFTVSHNVKPKGRVGELNIKFHTARFNAMGFLTHDTAVPIVE